MQWEGNHPANKSVLLIGAGGAGRAIAFAVASEGASTLTISDVDEHRARDLAAAVTAETGCTARSGPSDPHGFEVVINATPLGMKANDAMPVDPERLAHGTVVVDIINSAEPTPLLRAAQARGCRVQDGGPMHQ
jgi:shikimate dehydrogenase